MLLKLTFFPIFIFGAFALIATGMHKLILSYSNTGMISLNRIKQLALKEIPTHEITTKIVDYKHSTMGRSKDKSRDVLEALIIIEPK